MCSYYYFTIYNCNNCLISSSYRLALTALRLFNAVCFQSDPYVRLKWAHGLIGNERYEGYFKDLISRLADLAGFDYRLHLVADGKLGQEGEDGAWDGMVGKIIARVMLFDYY